MASGTARSPASPVSWRIASTIPRKPPAAPAWPTESWPPLVLFGKSPSCVSVCARTNAGPAALVAEAEILELQHDDHGIVIVGLDEVDVGRRAHRPARRGRRGPSASRRGPSPGRRHRHCGARSRRARAHAATPVRVRARSRITRKASAPAHGITQSNRWMGSEIGPGGHVLVERQRLLEQRVRILQRVAALGDGDPAEVLARRAEGAHVVGGDHREDRVRPARAVGVAGVAREVAEAAEREPERVDVVGVGRRCRPPRRRRRPGPRAPRAATPSRPTRRRWACGRASAATRRGAG